MPPRSTDGYASTQSGETPSEDELQLVAALRECRARLKRDGLSCRARDVAPEVQGMQAQLRAIRAKSGLEPNVM